MTLTVPASHEVDAHLLQADGFVFLYELTTLSDVTAYFKADNDVTWQGNYYSGTAVQISERSRDSDGKLSRPSLTIANPLAVYSPMVSNGDLDNATVIEKKVLYSHILANSNIYVQRTWRVRRPTSNIPRVSITLELRDSLDSQRFLLPARMYTPDAGFPSVSL